MTDQRIAYTEEMVGSGHPTKTDTLNRLVLVEHNSDGTHEKLSVGSDADGDIYYRSSGVLTRLGKGAADTYLRMNTGATAPEWSESDWIAYGTTSTIVGFSSFTAKLIYYKRIDNIIFVTFDIEGTSDSTETTFTIPTNAKNGVGYFGGALLSANDNGSTLTTASRFILSGNSNQVHCYSNMSTGAWTDSNAKAVIGSFFYVED